MVLGLRDQVRLQSFGVWTVGLCPLKAESIEGGFKPAQFNIYRDVKGFQ